MNKLFFSEFTTSPPLSFSIYNTGSLVNIVSNTRIDNEDIFTSIHSFKVGDAFNLSTSTSNYLAQQAAIITREIFSDKSQTSPELIASLKDRCSLIPTLVSKNFVIPYKSLSELVSKIESLPNKGILDDRPIVEAVTISHAVKVWSSHVENGDCFLHRVVVDSYSDLPSRNKLYSLASELVSLLSTPLLSDIQNYLNSPSFSKQVAQYLWLNFSLSISQVSSHD